LTTTTTMTSTTITTAAITTHPNVSAAPTTAATRKTGPNDATHVVWANSTLLLFFLLLLNNNLGLNHRNTIIRTTNGHRRHHGNNGPGTGQGQRRAAGARDLTCLQPLGMFLFCFSIFYLLNFYLHLELPRWRRTATPPPQHIETAATAAATVCLSTRSEQVVNLVLNNVYTDLTIVRTVIAASAVPLAL
jgi:hypothetical protein